MPDTEYLRIAIFRLEDTAKRLLEVSEQVQSRALRRKLLTLSRELTKDADALAVEGVTPSADEQ
jgi:hypothetical protein